MKQTSSKMRSKLFLPLMKLSPWATVKVSTWPKSGGCSSLTLNVIIIQHYVSHGQSGFAFRTFVEMDSHEEKVYQAVRQTQEREAKQKMREKAKELQRAKMEAAKRGGRPLPGGYTSMSGGFSSGGPAVESLSTPAEPPKPTFTPSK